MIENPAYTGRAMYGRFHAIEPQPRLCPIRYHPLRSSRPTTRVSVPRPEWVPVAVPALVDSAVAEAAGMQLEENPRRKREQCRGPGWLLQVWSCVGVAATPITASPRPALPSGIDPAPSATVPIAASAVTAIGS